MGWLTLVTESEVELNQKCKEHSVPAIEQKRRQNRNIVLKLDGVRITGVRMFPCSKAFDFIT